MGYLSTITLFAKLGCRFDKTRQRSGTPLRDKRMRSSSSDLWYNLLWSRTRSRIFSASSPTVHVRSTTGNDCKFDCSMIRLSGIDVFDRCRCEVVCEVFVV